MKWTKLLISILFTLLLVVALNIRYGSTPPLGSFFNPVTGFWQSADPQREADYEWLQLVGLRDSVLVVTDDRLVPHVFAKNNHDLYFAQGYLTARERLWQMDFQTRAAAGRLSEILGDRTVEYDLYQRRIGMVYGAENKLRAYEERDPEMMDVLWAYTTGVNTLISELKPRTYPIEFKLLGYEPESWNPLKSLLMHMSMSATLAGGVSSYQLTNTRAAFGDEFIEEMFPAYPSMIDPIIPETTEWDFSPIERERPESEFLPSFVSDILLQPHDPTIGSNSWAVHGSKTETGKPLLANDMHLQMTLPSIWYEMQLNAPDVNTYGVTIPGLPGVIVGINEDIAWGFTNSGASVLDIFEIRFRDESHREYQHDGSWKPTDYRVERVLVKGEEAVVDTVVYTHHGPVPFRESPAQIGRQFPAGHAIQWTAHMGTTDFRTFFKLNRADGYRAFLDAIQYFTTPAQNFTYADRHGTVALWHNGRFPLRWKGMGDYISDGSDPHYDWDEFIPWEHLPHSVNPERGFVSSANQHPVSPDYPYYLGRFFAPYERGARINDVLETLDQAGPEDMMLLQLDIFSLHAQKAIPLMLSYVEDYRNELEEPEMLSKLESWDFTMNAGSTAPTLYYFWWQEFMNAVWRDMYENRSDRPMRRPSRDRLLELMIEDPDSPYFTNAFANQSSNLGTRLKNAWNQFIQNLKEREPDSDLWEWWNHNNANVSHLADIDAFSRTKIHTDGASEAVNAIRGSHGPSWRMVVSLEDEIKAWGVYPGGQSGEPGSKHFDDFIDSWARGGFFPLHFFRSKDEALNFIHSDSETREVMP